MGVPPDCGVSPCIGSSRHPLVQAVREAGSDGALRRRLGVCVLEGTHLAAEAAALNLPLVVALCTPEFAASERGAVVVAGLRRLTVVPIESISEHASAPVLTVSPHVLKSAGELKAPEGILAVVRPHRFSPAASGVALALDGVQDPGNVGALARALCAFAGAAAPLFVGTGSADPFGGKALRASAGAVLRLAVQLVDDLPAALAVDAAAAGRAWWALQPRGGTGIDLARLPPCCGLIVGNEGHGCSAAVSRAHPAVTLQTSGEVESLGVAQAGAIALYVATRGRGDGRPRST